MAEQGSAEAQGQAEALEALGELGRERARLEDALRKLRGDVPAAVVAARDAGATVKETAEALGISPQALYGFMGRR
ncbi:MAG: hypothetical protein H0U59_03385 [Gemmatimonadaceae bacterium]|nr:hypothetical protein [Gemmatimonadaceae bacterium]